MMTMLEAQRAVQEIFPEAQFEEDNYGQIVIYTNVRESPSGLEEM